MVIQMISLSVCRTEQGYCSIGYTACSTSDFKMSTTGSVSVKGDSCSLDYVTIGKGGVSAGASTTADRFCGALLSDPTGTTTVLTNMQPFQVSWDLIKTWYWKYSHSDIILKFSTSHFTFILSHS